MVDIIDASVMLTANGRSANGDRRSLLSRYPYGTPNGVGQDIPKPVGGAQYHA